MISEAGHLVEDADIHSDAIAGGPVNLEGMQHAGIRAGLMCGEISGSTAGIA